MRRLHSNVSSCCFCNKNSQLVLHTCSRFWSRVPNPLGTPILKDLNQSKRVVIYRSDTIVATIGQYRLTRRSILVDGKVYCGQWHRTPWGKKASVAQHNTLCQKIPQFHDELKEGRFLWNELRDMLSKGCHVEWSNWGCFPFNRPRGICRFCFRRRLPESASPATVCGNAFYHYRLGNNTASKVSYSTKLGFL